MVRARRVRAASAGSRAGGRAAGAGRAVCSDAGSRPQALRELAFKFWQARSGSAPLDAQRNPACSYLRARARWVTGEVLSQTKVCCDPRQPRDMYNFPDLLPEDKRWDFGWRAIRHVLEHAHPGARGTVPLTLQLLPLCREAAQLASLFVGLTALSCDPNVLRLIAGEYTPHQCMMGMAADLKVRTNPSPRLHIRAQRRPNTNF